MLFSNLKISLPSSVIKSPFRQLGQSQFEFTEKMLHDLLENLAIVFKVWLKRVKNKQVGTLLRDIYIKSQFFTSYNFDFKRFIAYKVVKNLNP